MITINIPTELYNETKIVCDVLNTSIDEVVTKEVEQKIQMFRDENGRINLKRAKYLKHGSDAEKQAYKNAGKEPPMEEWDDCYYIRTTTIFGQSYVVIVVDGQIVKTPAENVMIE